MIRDFADYEAAGGLVLMAAAALAVVIANSPLSAVYFQAQQTEALGMTAAHWVNDGLMTVFFLLVGLEIKREMVDGQLSTWPRRLLPGVAALGGMAVPAAVYAAINFGNPEAMRGWAIPTATDIAFALGVLSLLGSRVPPSLKVFLTALAIIDDLGAVVVIALFYTANLSLPALGAAAVILAVLVALNRLGVRNLWPYLLLGLALWLAVLQSGIHATLAGVALALTIPARTATGEETPLQRLEHAIDPWVAYLIVPLFGFANAGVAFAGLEPATALGPVPLGIALGLILGKQIGVFGAVWLMVRLRRADVPEGATWRQVYGTAVLCGIGFTMSLFVGGLAFPTPPASEVMKVGVFAGSLASALLGAAVLRARQRL